MDTIRSLSRKSTTSPKPSTNAPIELQPTTPTDSPPRSQTPTSLSLFPAPLFSTSSKRSGIHIPNTSSSSIYPSISHEKITLEKLQQREEYIIEQYTSVLDTLEKKYLEIGNEFVETEPGSFEEKILRSVMDTLKQGMRENERHLEGQRRELWADWKPEEEEEKGEPSGTGVEEIRDRVEIVGWLSA